MKTFAEANIGIQVQYLMLISLLEYNLLVLNMCNYLKCSQLETLVIVLNNRK